MIGIVDGITRDRGFLFIKTADGERYFGHISAFVEPGLFGTIQVGAAVDFTPAAVEVEVGRKVAPRALAIRAIEPPRKAVGSCRPCELRRECYPDRSTARSQLTPDDGRRAVLLSSTD